MSALNNKARFLKDAGKLNESLHSLEAALKLSPNDTASLVVLCHFFATRASKNTSKLIKAVEYYDHALAFDENHLGALYNKGFALIAMEHYRDAEVVLNQVLRLDPGHYGANMVRKIHEVMPPVVTHFF